MKLFVINMICVMNNWNEKNILKLKGVYFCCWSWYKLLVFFFFEWIIINDFGVVLYFRIKLVVC